LVTGPNGKGWGPRTEAQLADDDRQGVAVAERGKTMVKRLGDVLVIAFTGTAIVVFFIGNSIAWWLIHMAKGDYYPIGYELEMDAAMFFALLVSAVLLIFIAWACGYLLEANIIEQITKSSFKRFGNVLVVTFCLAAMIALLAFPFFWLLIHEGYRGGPRLHDAYDGPPEIGMDAIAIAACLGLAVLFNLIAWASGYIFGSFEVHKEKYNFGPLIVSTFFKEAVIFSLIVTPLILALVYFDGVRSAGPYATVIFTNLYIWALIGWQASVWDRTLNLKSIANG
jgi:hypothetical protein